MANLNLTKWSTGVATYIQLMSAVQNQGYLNNGWNLWGRLHIYEREFERVSSNDTLWKNARAGLGMQNYSRTEAKKINNNDWMAIALSTVSKADVRPFLKLYGIALTQTADQQLNALALPALDAAFYDLAGAEYCDSMATTTLPLDGSSQWPSFE